MTRPTRFIALSLAAVVSITGFIFFNSFKDFAASHHISDPVTQIVDHYVEKPQNLDLSYLIRKAAHWIEFSALGAAVCCLIQSMGNEKKTLLGYGLFYLLLVGGFSSFFKNEELRWFFCIVLVAVGIVTMDILPLYDSFGEALRDAAFQVSSIVSTTGFATTNFDLWPTLSKGVLVLLMFFGACAGSTGGGIKISRVMVICKTALAQVRRQIDPRLINPIKLEGTILSPATRSGITAYMFAYLIIYVISTLLLCLDRFNLTVNFTAVAACINNIGPGLEDVGPMGSFFGFSPFSKLVLIFDMLAGRLEIFPMLALFSPSAWKKS